jgi:RNA polymerase sigma-70 factor, ECF subfamily
MGTRMAALTDQAVALPAGLALRRGARRQEDTGRMRQTGRAPGLAAGGLVGAHEDPDQPLLARLAKGDEGAYRLLVQRHLSRVFALGRRMLGNEHDAEDVAQEAFLRVWRHAPVWQPGRARFETWLYRVTLNLCYDRLRRRRETTVDEMPDVADESPTAIEAHAGRDRARQVEAALAQLPERQRAALVLCHYQELSNAEAARLLEITVEALESLLARGRRTLRTLLADHVQDLLARD